MFFDQGSILLRFLTVLTSCGRPDRRPLFQNRTAPCFKTKTVLTPLKQGPMAGAAPSHGIFDHFGLFDHLGYFDHFGYFDRCLAKQLASI